MKMYFVTLVLVLFFSILVSYHRIYSYSSKKIKYDDLGKIYFVLCSAVLIFVAGFRWYVGTDYGTYFEGYEQRVDEWLTYLQEFNEPGISILAKAGSYIYDSPITMFFLASFITIFLCTNTIRKYSNNFVFSILLYIFIGSWHGTFNGVRQYLAAAVLFAGHRFILEKKFWKYTLMVLIAMAFHRTAIIMLPIYFLVNKKFNWKNIGMIAGAVAIIRISYDYIFAAMSYFKGTDISQYSYMTTHVNFLRVCVAFAPVLIALAVKNWICAQNEETQMYIMLLAMNAGLSFATTGSAYLARSGIYTEMYAVLALPRLVGCFNRRSKKLVIIMICCCYFVFWLYSLNAMGVINYSWCFGKI